MLETPVFMCYDCVYSVGGEFRKRDDCESGECSICRQKRIIQMFKLCFVNDEEWASHKRNQLVGNKDGLTTGNVGPVNTNSPPEI